MLNRMKSRCLKKCKPIIDQLNKQHENLNYNVFCGINFYNVMQ